MPICTQCTYPVPYLYTLYQSVNNLRLEQCPNCLGFADPYVEHDALTLLLDLILLKREVYRHLLFNRGCEPRHMGKTGVTDATPETCTRQSRSKNTWQLVIQLGLGLILVDAVIRWRDAKSVIPESSSHYSFRQVVLACSFDTFSFHIGVTCASVLLLKLMDWFRIAFNRPGSPKLGTRDEFRIPLVSLTLFYSSFTKLFLLLLLAIWPQSSSPNSKVGSGPGAGLPAFVARLEVTQSALSLLDETYLDRAWVIRNVLGGMSAGFGLRVLLDCHPVLTTLVVLFGWLSKSLLTQVTDSWAGMGVALEYSIP